MAPEQASTLYRFLQSDRAAGVLRYIFLKMDVRGFNPHAAPPITLGKRQATEIGRSDLEAKIIERWESKTGCFQRDVVTIEQIQSELGTSILDRPVARSVIIKMLLSEPIKARDVIAAKWNAEAKKTDSARAYVVRNREEWIAAGSTAMYEELKRPPTATEREP